MQRLPTFIAFILALAFASLPARAAEVPPCIPGAVHADSGFQELFCPGVTRRLYTPVRYFGVSGDPGPGGSRGKDNCPPPETPPATVQSPPASD